MADSPLIPRKRLANLAGQHFAGARDLYATMGYPRHLTVEDYVDAYLRQDIAARIVDAFADATWRETPAVVADETFRTALADLDGKHQVWRTLHRADRLGGLGHYGIIMLGLDGGERMDTPATGTDYSLLYAQPHSERTAQIIRWDNRPESPRFGKPYLYRITTGVNWTGAGAGQKSVTVHHSRVIHFAERALEDESIGTPRLERVWNRLMDLDKLLGGSAEMYWQNVAMLMNLKADLQVEWDPEEADQLKEQIEEVQHGLRRWLRTRGIEAENIAPGLQGADPGNHIDRQLDVIAGSVGMPKRILIGSERGELSSAQDENNWAGRIQERREQYAGPTIAEAFISRGQSLGFLPRGDVKLEWPESDTLGEQGRADVAAKKAQAVNAYVMTPGAELVVSPDEFRAWLGEEAAAPQFAEDEGLDDEAVVQFNAMKAKG